MDQDKQMMEENGEEENFAELLKQSFVKTDRLEPGQRIKARIIKITSDWVFLDLGRKSEGYLSTRELLDEEGNVSVKEGDSIQAYYLSNENNEQLFTTKIGGGEAKLSYLEEAQRSGIPVEGLVEKEIKGGYEVKIGGSIRAFCPFSQMGLQRAAGSPSDYVGQRFPFKISEFGERGRNIVLSNRAVMEEQRQEQREALRATLQEGVTVRGTITSIRDFGAFVDIDGIEGLIPISEIAWGRVEDIKENLTVGQEVDVVVMKLDWEKNRFSFSLKGAMPDPWDTVEEKFPQGSFHVGKIARLANFGAFVTLAEGIDGLIHISKLGAGKRINHPREIVTEGQVLDVKIEAVDKPNKRLSLALADDKTEKQEQEEAVDMKRYMSEKPKSMGTLGDMLQAKLAQEEKKGKSKKR
jgi:small subunit ribosomal protein S1